MIFALRSYAVQESSGGIKQKILKKTYPSECHLFREHNSVSQVRNRRVKDEEQNTAAISLPRIDGLRQNI